MSNHARRRITLALIVFLLTALLSCPLSFAADETVSRLFLNIDFDSNLIRNKYDVSIELDGVLLDTIEYDAHYIRLCKVSPGKHTLRVYKSDDPEVLGEETITIKQDSTFQCQLKTKKKEIKLNDVTFKKDIDGYTIKMPDCEGLHLADASALLDKKGFPNYRYESGTEGQIDQRTFVVDAQNIKAGEKLDKRDEIVLTCIPCADYVQKTFVGLNYIEASAKAEAIGYTGVRIAYTFFGETL